MYINMEEEKRGAVMYLHGKLVLDFHCAACLGHGTFKTYSRSKFQLWETQHLFMALNLRTWRLSNVKSNHMARGKGALTRGENTNFDDSSNKI